MVQEYGLKTIDEIIEAEAAQGNSHAVNYAKEMYNTPEKLIKIFKLADVENKFVILQSMDDNTRLEVLPMLEKEDLERLDERYMRREDCIIIQTETDKRLDSIHEDVAVLKSRIGTLIAILSAIAVPVIGIAVKYLFGGG
jgi:hypothetical protein